MFTNVESFHRPASVAEALRLLLRGKGHARIVAGGTDLAVSDGDSVRILIDITRAGLSYIRQRGTACAIGATTTMAQIEESPLTQSIAGGILARAAATCGSVPIRNMATIGGNMANASPAADLATPLLALDAAVVIADAKGRHKLPLARYLETARNPAPAKSLLVEIVVPRPPDGRRSGWSFQKLGRTAVDISVVNVAAGMQVAPGGRVKWVRIALGAVAPTPIRAEMAEEKMTGRLFDARLLAEVAAAVEREVHPISDIRSSAEYRREIAGVLTRRALEECADHSGCSL
jgi:aerobic carbon-monoxide dehydrogenase medium subunit